LYTASRHSSRAGRPDEPLTKVIRMKTILFDGVSYVPAGHEDPLTPGVWKKVLFQRDDLRLGRMRMVNWARLPAGSTFTPHYHEDMQEIFIILSGTTRIRVGDEESTLRRGDAVLIDRYEIHQMWNEGSEDVEYLAIGIAAGEGGRTVLNSKF
jgi:mannose-6-phosphate isomerase-like protein (cupin superfamily)